MESYLYSTSMKISDVGVVSETPHWFALWATYGRERKAFDYLNNKGLKVFCPTKDVCKETYGKRIRVTQSLIPNVLFAYGTEEELNKYVYDNVRLPFLRYYYRHRHVQKQIVKEPLIVPDSQMSSFMIICEANDTNIVLTSNSIFKFESGKRVKIIDGAFKGVEGRVGRFKGQQRVGVVIEDFMTAITAYVPNAFLQECNV